MKFFDYSRPERQGISPSTIHRFLDACEREVHSLYSFTVVKGHTVAAMGYYEPMRPDQMKICHSLSKSFNALAVGIAIGDGKLRLDDRLVNYFPEDLPEQHDPRVERITVRDMLMMASNSAYTSATFVKVSGNWRKCYLGMKPYAEPGEWFAYDTGASYMLSCLVTKVMGKNSLEVLKERVFSYMGIEEAKWLQDADGNCTGGWGCYLKAEDLAKFGRLFLDYGQWEGRQLIPEWFMRQATSKQIDTYRNPGMGWPYGYGYQFWRYPEDTFGCFGAFGQLIVCDPKRDLYVTTTSGCSEQENQRLLRIITETIIAEAQEGPIPNEDVAYHHLEEQLEGLCLPAALGERESAGETVYFEKNYQFAENQTGLTSIAFARAGQEELEIRMIFKGTPATVHAGHKKWITSEVLIDTPEHTIHSFTYGWEKENCLIIKQYMCNSSYYKIYYFTFTGEGVEFSVEQNVTLYDDKREWVKSICEQ